MTNEEKRAIIEKNLEPDPALKAEYEALMAELPDTPQEAEEALAADPALRRRYDAVMAKATRGMELSDDELDDVNGGLSFAFFSIQSGKKGTAKKPWPASDAKKPQASTLVYNPATPPVATTLEHRGNIGGKVELL